MRTTVATFDVAHTSYLSNDGRLDPEHPAFADADAELVAMYEAMVLTRTFDAKAIALQRTGRLGTFASSLGQEAVPVGIAAAMRADDVLVPSFREQGAQIWRGVTPVELLLYWGGDERGSDFSGPREDFPISVPIGTHVAHATGVALAFQLRSQDRAAVCVFGDGATSRGDVYASMNFAGIRQLPVVYVVTDNQWAISVPRSKQSGAATLAQKAIGCGFTGEQVDGNDVVAVRAAVGEALERARAGDGPTLIEAVTYRLGDHTTADDAGRYRSDDEVSVHWRDDPIARLRTLLVERGAWGREQEDALIARCETAMDAAVDGYQATEAMPATAMFEHLYAELPVPMSVQRDEVAARFAAGSGGEDG